MATIDLQVAASSDDCYTYNQATIVLNLTDSPLVYQTELTELGARFNNVTIPNGATITVAYLSFMASTTNASGDVVTVYGIDEDDTATFSTIADFNGRGKTAGATWNLPAFSAGTWYDTSSLVTQVQAIVNRVSWASGNDMGFITSAASGQATRADVYHWDRPGNVSGAKLHVEYTVFSGRPLIM